MLSAYASCVIEQESPGLIEQTRQDRLIGLFDERLAEMLAQGCRRRRMIAGAMGAFACSVLLLVVIRVPGVDLVGLVQRASGP
jgi:type II secretory pathway component PulM